MKRSAEVIYLAALVMWSCQNDKQSQNNIATSQAALPPAMIYPSVSAFPSCDSTLQDAIFCAKDEQNFYVCNQGVYEITQLGPGANSDNEQTADGNDSPVGLRSIDCPKALANAPKPLGVAGQLSVTVPEDVNPCSVEGYVVGKKDTLHLEVTKAGEFFINNVPPGDHDIIVTAGSLAIGTLLTSANDADRGIRLNGLRSTTGLTTRLGAISLPTLGEISGVALLKAAGVADHAGIHVYIPGTGYGATTDKNGHYTISKVPTGTHALYFEKDGFGRGQLESLVVLSDHPTTVSSVDLYLETGASGTFAITNSFTYQNKTVVPSTTIDLLVAPSPGAVLMMLNQTGVEGLWRSVTTNFKLGFDVDKTLAASATASNSPTELTSPITFEIRSKFANANGLESDVVAKTVYLDLFTDKNEIWQQDFDLTLQTSPLALKITNIKIPNIAEQMKINYTNYVSYASNSTFQALVENYTIPLQDKIQSCGRHSVSIVFNAYGGKVWSPEIDDLAPFATSTGKSIRRDCHSNVASTTAVHSVSAESQKDEEYAGVWTGSKVFLMGWDNNQNLSGAFYTPQTNSWSAGIATSNGPARRKKVRLYALDNYIVAFGGYEVSTNNSEVLVYDMDVYDIAANSWLAAPASSPVFSVIWRYRQMAAIGDKLHLIYGAYDSGSSSNKMYIRSYDAPTNAWTSETEIPGLPDRTSFALLAYNNDVLIAGGKDNFGIIQRNVYRYDVTTNSVTSFPALPDDFEVTTNGQYTEVDNGKIYLGSYDLPIIYEYDGVGAWSTISLDAALERESFRMGRSIASLPFQSDMKLQNFNGGSVTRNIIGENLPRWESLHGNKHLVRVPIPNVGLFVWGGSYIDYTVSSSTQIPISDGAIFKPNFSQQWTN